MSRLLPYLAWLDKHIIKILVIGYAVLIPLYPKLPLQMVNYTYIAVRVEDIYVALLGFIALIWFIRGKMQIPWKYATFFILFWLVVFISSLYGFYVSKTVILNHLGLLHAARRVEYMMIFLIVFSTIRSRRDFEQYLKIIFVVLTAVGIYGLGQKFLGWPAVQTMNPEYAKGYLLVLDAYARISSTFAGHYDLAAYLIFLMPILIGYYLYTGKWYWFAIFILSLANLILTASRASYLAYLFIIIPYLLLIRKWKLFLIVLACTAILTPLSDNLTKRLTRTFQQTKVFVDPQTGKTLVPKDIRPDELPPGDFGANLPQIVPQKTKTVIDKKTATVAKKQIRETIVKEAAKSGKTLTEKEIAALVEKTFGRQIPVTKYLIDISLSTRFQVEWPRAINAFLSNPLIGTGPSSITEATDGDYLRWLGETGAIGTILFITIIGMILKDIFYAAKQSEQKERYLMYGFCAGVIGLLINALYIDVFEASKVAYTFWLVSGVFIAALPYLAKKHITTS